MNQKVQPIPVILVIIILAVAACGFVYSFSEVEYVTTPGTPMVEASPTATLVKWFVGVAFTPEAFTPTPNIITPTPSETPTTTPDVPTELPSMIDEGWAETQGPTILDALESFYQWRNARLNMRLLDALWYFTMDGGWIDYTQDCTQGEQQQNYLSLDAASKATNALIPPGHPYITMYAHDLRQIIEEDNGGFRFDYSEGIVSVLEDSPNNQDDLVPGNDNNTVLAELARLETSTSGFHWCMYGDQWRLLGPIQEFLDWVARNISFP